MMNTRILLTLVACHLAATIPSAFAQNHNPRAAYSDLLQVISPDPKTVAYQQGYTLTSHTGRVSIQVTFTQPVDPATLAVGKTVLLHFPNDPNADAQLTLSTDKRVLTITTRKSLAQLTTPFNPFVAGISFSLTLKGSSLLPWGGNGPVIKSLKGHVLDGNRDSKDGGDYKVLFSK